MKNFLIILFSLFSLFVCGQRQKDLEKERIKKIDEIDRIEKLISKTNESTQSNMNAIELIDRKIVLRNEIIENLNYQVESLDSQIVYLNGNIDFRKVEISSLKTEYAKTISQIYFHFKDYNFLMFLLSSQSFNQAYRRFYYFRQFTEHRRILLKEIVIEVDTLKRSVSNLLSVRKDKAHVLALREDEKNKMENDKNLLASTINENKRKVNKFKKELETLNLVKKKIETEIRRIIEEEARKKVKLDKKQTEEAVFLSNEFSKNKNKLPWPVSNGTVYSYFGEHKHPYLSGVKINNFGIDISFDCNQPVKCVFKGVISKIFAIKGANTAIIIRHGDYLSVYQNLSSVSVKVGDNVDTNQRIGSCSCADNGKSTNLHFEIWKEFNKEDPMNWLKH